MRKITKKNFFNKTYFLAILILIVFSYLYLFYQYSILNSYKVYVDEITSLIENEKNIEKQLKKESEYKNSDEYIEKIAREKLGMIKSNEIIFFNDNK